MRSMRKAAFCTIAAVSLALPIPVWASYFCTGPIDYAGINPDGSVIVSSAAAGLSYVVVCSVSAQVNNGVYGITTDTCKGILATLLRAQATGATVQWGFLDNLSCSSAHTAFAQLTGLYFGPIVQTQ